ncbi:hypothetical protein NKH91_05975 [Mesorhizobium sp. M0894]|uniref:hypothetical protein n=1 Tax=unclassified Mesorhizobium TaxID=325217 RepID=UPI00333C5956
MISGIKIGSNVRCIRAAASGGSLVQGGLYTVTDISPNNRHLRVKGVSGSYMISRFELVEAKTGKTKKAPFGQVKAVTVNKSDIHDVLTQYVRFALGIDASVAKIVEKFPEAIELVLSSEATA